LEVGGQDGGAQRAEGYADEVVAGDNQRGFARWCDADKAAAAVETGGDVDVSIFGEGEALGDGRGRSTRRGFGRGSRWPRWRRWRKGWGR